MRNIGDFTLYHLRQLVISLSELRLSLPYLKTAQWLCILHNKHYLHHVDDTDSNILDVRRSKHLLPSYMRDTTLQLSVEININPKSSKTATMPIQGAQKFQEIFLIPPLLEPCKTVPYLNLREITNLLKSLKIKGFHANYVKCYSITQL